LSSKKQVTGGVTGAREIVAVASRLNSTNDIGNFEHHPVGNTFSFKNNNNQRFKKDNKKARSA